MKLLRPLSIVGPLAAAFLVSGCSHSSQSLPQPPAATTQAAPSATGNLQLPTLTCENNDNVDDCGSNGAVGELVVATKNGTRYCTVSLVAPDLVLTASHCIPGPESLAADHASVTGGCWVRFPQTDGSAAIAIPCTRILDASLIDRAPTKTVRADHAFIQISVPQPARQMLSLSEAATAPHRYTRVGGHRISHPLTPLMDVDELPSRGRGGSPTNDDGGDDGGDDGSAQAPPHTAPGDTSLYGVSLQTQGHVIVERECSRDDNATIPELRSLKGETIVLSNCQIEPGYSGGPIFNHDGRVDGVVSFRKSPSTDDGEPDGAVGTKVHALPNGY